MNNEDQHFEQQLRDDLAHLADRVGPGPTAESVRERIRQSTPPRRFFLRLPLAAAAAACLVAALWLGLSGDAPSPKPGTPELVGCQVSVVGEASYEIVAPRRIRLERGELHLSVQKADEPLSVETPAGTATALGTEFYVKTQESEMTRKQFVTTVLVLSGIVQLSNPLGLSEARAGEALAAGENSAPRRHVEELAIRFSKHYKPRKVVARPQVAPYELPLDLTKIVNYEQVVAGLRLKLLKIDIAPLLRKNGFVAIPSGGADMVMVYERMKSSDLPVFVTADTLLHLYHIQFAKTLRDIERYQLHDDIVALSRTIQSEALAIHAAATGDAREAAALLLGYGTVGVALQGDTALVTDAKELFAEMKDWEAGPGGRFSNYQTFDVLLSRYGRLYTIIQRRRATTIHFTVKSLRVAVKKFIDEKEATVKAVPKPVAAAVQAELALINKHVGFQKSPLFGYQEDYSQYVPRGHYTQSATLSNYFRAMMWYGRMTFLLKPALVSNEEARRQTLAAAMLTDILKSAKVADGRTAKEVWERVYGVTAFYVGVADDLGWQQYGAALTASAGPDATYAALLDKDKLHSFQLELAKLNRPAIYGGTGNQAGTESLRKTLDKTTGFRLMGRRFMVDSYAMGRLVFPTVGNLTGGLGGKAPFTSVPMQGGVLRGFPRGLDVMALLGSSRARELLTELGDDAYGTAEEGATLLKYSVAFDQLKAEFGALSDADWNRNAYWSWLHALKPLIAKFGAGYPTFMTTQAWRDKSLTTALASWAQLRHDTILYAKQSSTKPWGVPQPPKPVEGYVEPVPEFYARMLALTQMTRKGLADMKVADGPGIKRLEALEQMLARLLDISIKELANKELTPDDYKYIRNFAGTLRDITVKDGGGRGYTPHRTTMIADVHTDSNSKQVLEEATGHVDQIVVCYRQPDGRLVLGVGPALSYYEFKQPMSNRLTDEAWRKMLRTKPPARPEWMKSYLKQ